MRWLLILFALMLAGSCAHVQEQPTAPAPVATPTPPCRYQVVYRRDRGTWVDPGFVAIEHRGEYLLEAGTHGRKDP